MRHLDRLISSMCHDPIRWHGIGRQRSVSTETRPVCRWQCISALGRFSYQDRSWRRKCSSRSVAWSLVSQTQSPLQEGCIHSYHSSTLRHNERSSEEERKNKPCKTCFFWMEFTRARIYMNTMFWLGIMAWMQISLSRFKQSRISPLIPHIYVLGYFVNFLVIFGIFEDFEVFFKGWIKFMEKGHCEDLVLF